MAATERPSTGRMNVLVTGTPGTGKSSLCASIADELREDGYRYIEVGAIVKEHGLHEGKDEVRGRGLRGMREEIGGD